MPNPSRLTVTMAAALELVAAGHPPRVAASRAGVHLVSLYDAMRRTGMGERCPCCGHIVTLGRARRSKPPEGGTE